MKPSTATVATLGEQGLLAALRALLDRPSAEVPISVGDDAAVLAWKRPGLVVTSDLLVEGVDFKLEWARWADVGHKAAHVNLSDLAAMGAKPRALVLSLALRPTDRVRDVLELVRTMAREGKGHGAPLVGGDLSRTSGPLVVSVTALGEVLPTRALRRGRGRPGDQLWVTGSLGAAAAGLQLLMAGRRQPASLVRRQLRPTARVAFGQVLAARAGLVRSAADISDGLLGDVLHVVEPGAGAALDTSRLPLARGLARIAAAHGWDAIDLALAGGEDFELVLAVEPRRARAVRTLARRAGVALTQVGVVTRRPGVSFVGASPGADVRAFDHFAGVPALF